jgi:predicted permease
MDLFEVVAASVAPAFIIIGLGYLFGRRGLVDISQFVNFVIYLGTPSLIIDALATHNIDPSSMLTTALAAAFVVFGVGALAFAYTRITGDRSSEVLLCSMFGNTGNIPWPLALFAFGDAGLAYQVVYAVMTATLLYSVGVGIAAGKSRGALSFLKLPLVYASVIGVVLSVFDVHLPAVIMRPIGMLADTTIPLLLFTLGIEIGRARPGLSRPVLAIVSLRVLGGAAAGLLFLALVNPPLEVRRAVILASCAPSAVHAFMLSAKYNGQAPRAASAVFYSTLAAMIYLPFVLAYLMTLE